MASPAAESRGIERKKDFSSSVCSYLDKKKVLLAHNWPAGAVWLECLGWELLPKVRAGQLCVLSCCTTCVKLKAPSAVHLPCSKCSCTPAQLFMRGTELTSRKWWKFQGEGIASIRKVGLDQWEHQSGGHRDPSRADQIEKSWMAPFGVGEILAGLCGWGGAGLFPHISMHWGWMWCLLPSQPNEGSAIWTASPKLNGLGCSGQPTRTWLPASPAQQAQGWQRPRHPVVLPTGSLWDATQLLPCPMNKADLPTRASRPGGDCRQHSDTSCAQSLLCGHSWGWWAWWCCPSLHPQTSLPWAVAGEHPPSPTLPSSPAF